MHLLHCTGRCQVALKGHLLGLAGWYGPQDRHSARTPLLLHISTLHTIQAQQWSNQQWQFRDEQLQQV